MTSGGAATVRDLLERAVAAGFFSGAVARWGSEDASTPACVAGRTSVLTHSRPVDPSTWFDLASLTKPLATTTLCLLAFESRAMAPETAVGEVLTELRSTPSGGLTVLQLLTHSSGLPAWVPVYCLAEGRPENAVRSLVGIGLEAAPGTRVVYSCVGFLLLGWMIERVSNQTIDRAFNGSVARPLGLDLGFRPNPAAVQLADGAVRAAAEITLVREMGLDPRWIPETKPGLPDDGNSRLLGGAAGNAGLFGTAEGVWRLAREYTAAGGELLSDQHRAEATHGHTAGLEQARGLGWQIASSPGCSAGSGLSDRAFGHTGFTGTSVWAEPDGDVRVLLTNRNHPVHRGLDLHPIRRRFHALTR